MRAVESKLEEGKRIGLSWAVLDYDGGQDYTGFWNLSHKTTMYGNASDLVAFRLMPLEERFLKPLEARWSFQILDMSRRLVAFETNHVASPDVAMGFRRWFVVRRATPYPPLSTSR